MNTGRDSRFANKASGSVGRGIAGVVICVVAEVFCLGSQAFAAKDESAAVAAVAFLNEPAPTPGLQSPAPRASDTDASVAPMRWTWGGEYTRDSSRWVASRGTLDIAMSLETGNLTTPRNISLRGDAYGPRLPALPSFSVGLRQPLPTPAASASSLLDRSFGSAKADSYLSKVGVEWKPAETRLQFLREGLGFRLDGNDRMTVRLRKGVLGVYMHRKF